MNPPRVYMSSETGIPLPPPIPYHLSGSSPCTSPKHPVSCIEHRPTIRFLHDSIHVSVPFSQIIPHSPSPSESKSPLYTSVSLLLSHMYISYIYINHSTKMYIKLTFILQQMLIGCLSRRNLLATLVCNTCLQHVSSLILSRWPSSPEAQNVYRYRRVDSFL